ncbi:S41 family peptidase [Clostridium sp. CCUG 7971]|uniref:S41 family peptidase n=1 Tax=Clostridium sp. CCUG 7971 TaxID=2811414 RepID=UPI001ABBC26C|nr:S41 family peptidase [Clostridium sp. CCUG 7971]MBO3443038.1 peptidase S41 [Clostridium sp. CCUG 7971]
MKRKVLFTIIIFIFVIFLGTRFYNKSDQLSTKEKVSDFKYVYNIIKDGYPYLDVNMRRNNINWLDNKDKYLKRIKDTKNDEEFIEELSSILSDLGNRHTEVIDNKNRYELFKKSYSNNNWYDFLDDKKVVDRYNSIRPKIKISKDIFLKKELTLKDIVKDEVGYIYLPSMASRNGSTDKDLNMIWDYINASRKYKALIIDIRGNLGGSDSYWQGIVSRLIKNDTIINGYRVYRNSSKIVKKYTNVRNIGLKPIEKLPQSILINAPQEIFNDFSDFEEASYTIKAKDNLNFEGNIYLLIDDKVYSSSESFSMFCKETNFATLIGKTTGGDGRGLDPILFKLKNSGLIVRMASGMYLNKDGICDEEFKTTPDFKVKNCERTRDFKDDNCIKKVLELENIS